MTPTDTITENLALAWKQQRVNVLPGVTARGMASLIDSFDRGYLRQFALACEEMIERDETLVVAVPKMKRRVTSRPWDVLIGEEVPEEQRAEAERHQAALKFAYSHMRTENAVEKNESGGMKLLIRRMMSAPLNRFAVSRLIWRPSPEGLTFTARFCPLALFDNTQGELRWAGVQGNTPGAQITDPENWLIAVSDTCLMKALSICYIFKRLPMQDALNFCQRFGIPAVHGMTDATPGSTEWQDFVVALRSFANDLSIATSKGSEIKVLENTASNGEQVFGWIIEMMKRAMVTICCGSDLATMSRENGTGASLQSEDADEMTADYCEFISETFNEQLDRRIIEDQFGPGTKPLAFFKLLPPQNTDTELEMKVDKHAFEFGVNMPPEDIAERYGRTHVEDMPEDDVPEEVEELGAANEALSRLRTQQSRAFVRGVRSDLAPLNAALQPLIHAQGADATRNAAMSLNLNMSSLEEAVLDGNASTAALEVSLATELLRGLAGANGSDVEASNELSAANARGGMKRLARGPTLGRLGKFDEAKHKRGTGGKFADKPGAGDDAPSKSAKAKDSAVRIGRDEQRKADELEHAVAKDVGGVSFKDSEPVDVVIGQKGVIEHGIEFKAVLSGKNDKLTMNSYAQVRKIDWEKRNKTAFHTLVADVRGGKPVYYYRRGVAGSARLGSLHRAKDMSEVKKLLRMPDKDLPAAAQRTDAKLKGGRWKFFEDAEGKGYRDLKTGTVHRAKK